jgi:hypothetical protein
LEGEAFSRLVAKSYGRTSRTEKDVNYTSRLEDGLPLQPHILMHDAIDILGKWMIGFQI